MKVRLSVRSKKTMTVIKKLGAIALGSILVASTLAVGFSQLTVKDAIMKLGAPGTDFWIVVGKDARVDDVLAGIDIAARFAEFAATQKTLAGTTDYTVKGWDARLELNSQNLGTGLPGFMGSYDKNVLQQLKEIVVQKLGTGTYSGNQEKVSVGTSVNLAARIYGNTTLALAFSENPTDPYITYYVDLTNAGGGIDPNEVNPASGKVVKLKLAGKDMIITGIDVSNQKVKLLDGFGPEWMSVGDVKNITGTNYKIRLDNVIGFGSDAIVQLSVIDDQGRAYPMALSPNQYDVEPTTGVKVFVVRGFGFGEPKMAYIAAGLEKEVDANTRIDNIFKWHVQFSGGKLTEIGYALYPNETVYLDVGKSIAFPNNYLKLTNLGLTLTDKDYLATVKVRVVDIDANKVDKGTGASCGSSTDTFSSVALEVSGVSAYDSSNNIYDKVYGIFKTTSGSEATLIAHWDSTNNKYVCFTSGSISLGSTDLKIPSTGHPSPSTTQYGLKILKSSSDYITITVDTDTNKKVLTNVAGNGELAHGITPTTDVIGKYNNTYVYTAFGHKLFVTSDAKEFRLYWTPVQGYLRVALGDVVTTTVGGGTYKELDVSKLSVQVAKFDDEVATDSSLAKNLVVVGGPYVNKVAAALLNIPYQAGDQITAYYESLGAVNKGLVKAFDNAFGSGKVALLVAGWRAEDTRLAASVLQQYDKFLADLAQGHTLVIGGTVESPSISTPTTASE